MKCTCGGTFYFDLHCLKSTERKLIKKRDWTKEQLDDIESQLNYVRYHLENPLCHDCGESEDHCICE